MKRRNLLKLAVLAGGKLSAQAIFRASGISTPPPSSLAIVNTGTNSSQTAVTTLTASAVNATTGNAIVVWARQGAANTITGTVTDTAGNTYTNIGYTSLGSGDRAGLWYAKNITGNASNSVTVTWSVSSGFTAITVIQISGASTSAPLDTFVAGSSGAANSITSLAFTTGVANTVVIMAASIQSLGNVYTPNAGYTLVTTDPDTLNGVQCKIVSSIQTGITPVMTSTQTAAWEEMTVSIK